MDATQAQATKAAVRANGARFFAGRLYAAFYFIRSRGKIRGRSYILRSPSLLRITSGGYIRFGEGVTIEKGARIVARNRLDIGAGTYVGKNATMVAFDELIIGEGSLLAENVSVHTEDHGPAGDRDNFMLGKVTLGDNVWIGAGAVITRGIEIGARTTIGANAVVTRDIPADSLAVGVPARVKSRTPLS